MSCENCEEEAYVIDKLAKLLAEIAVIVNGPEPPLTSWSYHDLPEKVRALKQAPPAAPVVTLPCGWHIVPRHLPDEVLVDTGCIDGYDGQRGDAEHRAWWESAIDSLAVRVPCPVLTYTQAPPAPVAVPEGYALVPVEPTDDMVRAGAWEYAECKENDVFSRPAAENIWSQMVTQATTAAAKGEP